MKLQAKERLFDFLNVIEVLGIFLVLFLAITFQFIYHELPCPLCLLQRVGFAGIAIGLLLNLRFYPRTSHYALVLLSAIFTSFVALRQIALHVVPGTGSYGNAIFGFHLYTWSFILTMIILIYTTIVLGFGGQYANRDAGSSCWKYVTHICFALVTMVVLINAVSTYAECGFKQCPENPVHYRVRL